MHKESMTKKRNFSDGAKELLVQLWLGQGKRSVLRIDRESQAFADLGPRSSYCGRADDHKKEV